MDTIYRKVYYTHSLINIVLLFFLSILSSNIYSGLSFTQVGIEKQYLIYTYKYNMKCFLRNSFRLCVSHLFVHILLMK